MTYENSKNYRLPDWQSGGHGYDPALLHHTVGIKLKMNYPDPRVEVSKTTLTPAPPLSQAKEGEMSYILDSGSPLSTVKS